MKNEEKYDGLFNPSPEQVYKYSWRDMMDCWNAGRENLVRWGIGDGDKPGFSKWIEEFYNKNKSQHNI